MIVSIGSDVLKEKLSHASRFCFSRLSSVPSLQGGLLSFDKNDLNIITTNLNDFFHTKLKMEEAAKEERKAVVDIKKIVEFLNYVKPGKTEITLGEKEMKIKSEKTEGTFGILPHQDFPNLPTAEGVEIRLENAFIKNGFPLVTFSAAKDEARPILTGVNFSSKDDKHHIVSTDGFRLSVVTSKQVSKIPHLTVSASMLSELVRIIDDNDATFYFSDTEKIAKCVFGESEIFSRFIEGDFPAFEKVVPTKYKTRIAVVREEFLRNIKLVSVFARDVSSTVVFTIKKDGLYVKPRTNQQDNAVVHQELKEFEGEETTIAFNYRFLLDFLNNTESKTIFFEMTEPTSPGVFKLDNNKDFLHIIMPIRTEEGGV